MRKWRNLIILVVILGLLGGSLVYLNKHPKKQDDGSSSSSSGNIEVSKIDSKKIVKMELDSNKGTLVLEKKGDKWIVPSSPNVTLEETVVNDLLDSFANVNAERVVKDPGDISQYGLKPPAVTAKATLDDNSQKIFYLGNTVPGSSMYYLMVEGKSEVYAVWVNYGEHFSYTLSDIRDKSLPVVDSQSFTYFLLKPQSGRAIEIKENPNQDQDVRVFGANAYDLLQSYDTTQGADISKMQDALNNLANMKIDSFEDSNPANLAKYGLDKPKYELEVKDSKNTLHLLIGNDKDDNDVYCKTPDSNEVFTVSKSVITSFTSLKPFTVVDKLVSLVNIDALDQLTLEYNGNKVVFDLSRTTKKATKEGEEDEVTTTYKMDGKDVVEDTFKKFYQQVIGVTVDAESEKSVTGKPDLKITYKLNRGNKKTMVMEYIPYNADFYGAVKDGKTNFVVSKAQIQNLINTIDLMRKGQYKPEN